MNISPLLDLIGQISIAVMLIVLGLLSKRLGNATRAKPQYVGFYVAASLILAGVVLRALNLIVGWMPLDTIHLSLEWVLIYNGLPAVGITLGVIFGWRYWSWLLAERD